MFSEIGQCSFTAAKESLFPTVSWQQTIFAINVSNHREQHTKLTPSESWDQDGFFFSRCLRNHQIQIVRPEFLQCSGTQIRVNIGVGSEWQMAAMANKFCLKKTTHMSLNSGRIIYSNWTIIWRADYCSRGWVPNRAYIVCLAFRPKFHTAWWHTNHHKR